MFLLYANNQLLSICLVPSLVHLTLTLFYTYLFQWSIFDSTINKSTNTHSTIIHYIHMALDGEDKMLVCMFVAIEM